MLLYDEQVSKGLDPNPLQDLDQPEEQEETTNLFSDNLIQRLDNGNWQVKDSAIREITADV